MSLKAKLEAVIYAAEEPVTLAQLAALFAADALEWKSAQESAAAATAEQAAPDSQPLLNAEFDYQGPEQPSDASDEAPEVQPEVTVGDSQESPEEPSQAGAAEAGSEALAEPAAEA